MQSKANKTYHKTKWSDEELQQLAELVKTHPVERAAEILNRPCQTCERKLREMQVRYKKYFECGNKPIYNSSEILAYCKPWTAGKEHFIEKLINAR